MTRRLLLCRLLSLTGLVAASLGTGCSGGRSSDSPTSTERSIVIAVNWPPRDPTRLIPKASNSIEIRVTRGGEAVSRVVLNRPPAGGQVRATIGRLPIGTLTATAAAYPDTNANGVAQAYGVTHVSAEPGHPITITIEMDSTIDHIDVASDQSVLFVNDSVRLSATPRDSNGNMVLVGDTLRWSVNTSRVDIDETTGQVTARSAGSAEITVEETESGVRGSASLRVKAIDHLAITPSPALLLRGEYADLAVIAYDTDGDVASLSDDAWQWSIDNSGIASIYSSGASALVSGSDVGHTVVHVSTVAGGEIDVPIRVYEDTVSGTLSVRRSGYDKSGTLSVSGSDISVTLSAGTTSGSTGLSNFAVDDSRTVLVELSDTDDTFGDSDSVDFTLDLDGPQTEQGRSFFVFSDSGSSSVSGSLTKSETSQTFRLQVRDPITGETRSPKAPYRHRKIQAR